MKHRRILSEHGYTLMELVVATAVAGILLLGIMTFLTTTLVNNSIRSARADLLREAQLTLDVLTRDIRLSANVDETNRWEDDFSPDADITNGLGWVSDESTLVLATVAEDIDRNILFQDATHYITHKNNNIYFVDNGSLYKRTLAAPIDNNRSASTCPADEASPSCPADRRLVQNVRSFTVRYFNSMDEEVAASMARSVEVSLSLQATKYGREVTADYTTRTVFRNE